MLIDVTQEDITLGVPGDSHECPVARAIRRATGARTVSVASKIVAYLPSVGREADRHEAGVLLEVALFVRDFDDRKPVAPFSFPLDLDAEARCSSS